MPVVEYEPPVREVSRIAIACRQLPLARRASHGPHRPYGGRGVGQPGPSPAHSAAMRQAAMFADAALRRVLEVIDHRRPATQLRPLLVPALVDSVLALSRSAPGHRGAAVLRRMRLQPANCDTAAEVFGCYSRADRTHAIAARVEVLTTGGAARWQVVALHIG
ncbi:Rv3235 family protein [Mycobacterium sherrisii]|uniref:Alanine, arginine and proline rich protein n=1 Tax=Mycobacterium sherrisii TaxID=243061 RepID=A0A1E3SIL4_9MYCO|nr:Rv3235 family protein [Mycobacterium sherrisii]MCV7028015.1 hypothetical protein [Mycobacterium sherrisii]MEC4765095.1 Rv3235 family protein [Mycobacterium sherrisii]ODR01969.1 hypothetical protein BHQ21_22945 [Mycobacterium sherrisii]ORW84578.1 hypothetical protein AWC25_24000 [Mycobacterium sherrisii]